MRRALLVVAAATMVAAGCNRSTAAGGNAPATNSDVSAAAASSAGPSAAEASSAAAPQRERLREVTLPAGAELPIVFDSGVGSDTSRVEQRVSAHLSHAVVVHGATVVPAGSEVSGVVSDATRSGKVKGRAHVAVHFDTLVPRGTSERYAIRTSPVGRTAESTRQKDALKIGAPAAAGGLIGGLLGGGKGALIGAAAGGGAGTAVVLSTRGKEVHLPKGTALTLRLTEPVTIKVAS